MRNLLVCVCGVLLTVPVHAQSADGSFETADPIALNGTVVGVTSWTGTQGPEPFRPVQRGEQVVVTGFAPKNAATLQELLPYSTVPVLAPTQASTPFIADLPDHD